MSKDTKNAGVALLLSVMLTVMTAGTATYFF